MWTYRIWLNRVCVLRKLQFILLLKLLEHLHHPPVQHVFDLCLLFSSLQVVPEWCRQNLNRPKLFCRYTRLAQARSSSGHENRLSSQVDKISGSQVLKLKFSGWQDPKRWKARQARFSWPDTWREREEVGFLPRENFDSSQIIERLTNGWLCSKYLNDWLKEGWRC